MDPAVELQGRELLLLEDMKQLSLIVQDTDWFLQSCIEVKRAEIRQLYVTRKLDEMNRYQEWRMSQP